MITTTVDFDSDREKLGFYRVLKALKGKFNIEIKKLRKKRSVQENAYYWSVVVGELSRSLGYFPDEIHNILKMKFLREDKVIRATGELVPGFKSTKDLTTAEFEAYCENVRIWALADLDVFIPLPNERI